MTEAPVIEVEGATKAFRRRPVLQGVDLTIERGGVYAIQGPNGSGKSVLLRLMSLLMRPDIGQVRIHPRYLPEGRTYPDSFGILIDRPGFIPSETGLANLSALAAIWGKIGPEEIVEWMTRLRLDPTLTQKMKAYSQGMIQKVGLIQALMEHQEVLLLDEPFTALDEDSVAAVQDVLLQLVDEGRTLVFTSHDKEHVAAMSARTYVMSDGRLKAR